MPTFQITSPDGRKFRVTAPEGASREQVMAYAKQKFGAAPARPAYQDPDGGYSPTEGQSFLQNAAAGAGKSVADTWEGTKQLFGFGNQSAIDERARLDAPLMQTGGGLTGNIAGQVAQMANRWSNTAFCSSVNSGLAGRTNDSRNCPGPCPISQA